MKGREEKAQWLLLIAVFVIASCGLIYELVAGTLASYLLGDSITQFSTVIGVYLFAMGIGSFLSKYLSGNLLQWFIRIELILGLIGGFSSVILFLTFPLAASFRIILYGLVCLTGILVGLEIPLLMRILKDKIEFNEMVSRVFTFDYIGALLASLLFPLLFVPQLGLIRTSLFFGILNIGVGTYLIFKFNKDLPNAIALKVSAFIFLFISLIGFLYSEKIMSYSESMNYNDRVVYAKSSAYQRIVITKNSHELRLFLNGNLQFSTADEYRYHEALVHPILSSLKNPEKVLVLGGGDGLAIREILKYPSVKEIKIVDLDPAITRLFRDQPMLNQINESSLKNSKVEIINEDAFLWLRENKTRYDAIIIDFPDPSNFSIGKLYSTAFYNLLKTSISPSGIAVIQSTSPFVAPKSFWCINQTINSVGLQTIAYHNYVPSFGEWGYIMAMPDKDHDWFTNIPDGLKYIDKVTLQQMLVFPKDMIVTQQLQSNKLNNQALVSYFEEEWGAYLD